MIDSRKVKAFIFDLDDTLVDSEKLNIRLISDYFRHHHGVEMDDEDAEYVYGHSWQSIYRRMVERYQINGVDIFRIQEGVLKTKKDFLSRHTIPAASGIREVMALPQRKVIVSGSGKEEIAWILENAGLTPYIERDFSIEEYEKGKPEPDGFFAALDYLKLPAEQCLVFEDASSGIEGAKRAGIPVVFIAEFASSDQSGIADFHYPTFADFYRDFTGNNGG